MYTLITIIHCFVCIFLMLVVLLQAGKGGGMGIAFGSAGAQQVFGGRGAGGLLERVTAGTAIVFLLTSVTLAHHASRTESTRLVEISDQKKKARDEAKAKTAAEDAAAAAAAKKDLEKKGAAPGPSGSAVPVAPLAPPAEQVIAPDDNARPAAAAKKTGEEGGAGDELKVPAPIKPKTEKPAPEKTPE